MEAMLEKYSKSELIALALEQKKQTSTLEKKIFESEREISNLEKKSSALEKKSANLEIEIVCT